MAHEIQSFTVSEADHHQRLDRFLVQMMSGTFTRSLIQKNITSGAVTIDGAVQTNNAYKVKQSQSISVKIQEIQELDAASENLKIDILYQDDDVIVVNKAAGMSVHPSVSEQGGTLVNALLYHVDGLSGIGGVERPGIVHRLDKGTSGVMIVAKNDKAHQHLCKQFQERTINRTYQAICYGVPIAAPRRIETLIGRHPADRKKMAVVDKGGKHAVSTYTLAESYGKLAARLVFKLHTGRTHQIRVHAAHLGYPLIGDPLYGGRKRTFPDQQLTGSINALTHQMLHAEVLGFEHPSTGEMMTFTAPPPADMQGLIDLLSKIR